MASSEALIAFILQLARRCKGVRPQELEWLTIAPASTRYLMSCWLFCLAANVSALSPSKFVAFGSALCSSSSGTSVERNMRARHEVVFKSVIMHKILETSVVVNGIHQRGRVIMHIIGSVQTTEVDICASLE